MGRALATRWRGLHNCRGPARAGIATGGFAGGCAPCVITAALSNFRCGGRWARVMTVRQCTGAARALECAIHQAVDETVVRVVCRRVCCDAGRICVKLDGCRCCACSQPGAAANTVAATVHDDTVAFAVHVCCGRPPELAPDKVVRRCCGSKRSSTAPTAPRPVPGTPRSYEWRVGVRICVRPYGDGARSAARLAKRTESAIRRAHASR